MREEAPVICAGCAAETHWLEVFPGGICLACYEAKMDGVAPEKLYEDVMNGFGNGGVFAK
jgi:hypothetical protein